VLDIQGIQKRLDKLDQYVQILRELRAADREQFVSDYHLYGLAERYLHLSIECLLDIANMLVSGLGLRKPERYQEAVDILAEAGVLSAGVVRRLAGVAGFRNILVHEYLEVDRGLVYQYLQENLGDLKAFAQEVIRFVRSWQMEERGRGH
jgi:uncharacterized protein YutE (UPF0331/DUF86 family)